MNGEPNKIMSFDIDQFYSQEDITIWQQIIGDDLHYHYGYFLAKEDLCTGARQTVQNFYDDIPHNSTVLDAGCGWGGPAQMLLEEQKCNVKGLTISKRQLSYCHFRGLNVALSNLEQDEISGKYDIAFMLEVLSHLRDKHGVLHKLRNCASRLILSVNCIAKISQKDRHSFGNSMVMCTELELEEMLKATGWRIIKKRNRRFQSLRTIYLWQERFSQIYPDNDPPGQLFFLKNLVTQVAKNPVIWLANNPLIDIVAE